MVLLLSRKVCGTTLRKTCILLDSPPLKSRRLNSSLLMERSRFGHRFQQILACVVLNQTGQSPYPRFFRENENLLILFHSCRAKECEVEYVYGELKRMPFVRVG